MTAHQQTAALPMGRFRAPPKSLRWFATRAMWIVGAAVVFVISAVPLLYIIDMAFRGESRFGLSDLHSLAAVTDVYTSAEYLGYLAQSMLLAVLVTGFSVVIGVVMALLVSRFRMPCRNLLDILIIMPLFLSPFTGLLAWIALGSAKTGFITMLLGPLVDIWNFTGVVWVMVLFFAPFAYLFTVGSFAAMNGSLEEAARTSGASPMQTIWRITLPMSLPSIVGSALLIFVLSAEMYTIPGIIGPTAGFTTLPFQIYQDATGMPARLAHAAAGGTILLSITILGVLLQRRVARVSARFVSISGKGAPSRKLTLGRWRWPAIGFVGAYILLADILPFGALVVSSLMKFSSGSLTANIFTTGQYVTLFSLADAKLALWNTIWVALSAALICLLLGFAISYRDVRRPGRWINAIALMAILPVAVPGLVYGLGLASMYLTTPLYGTATVLLLAHIAKFLPYAIVVSRSGLQQIHRELEEGARMSGANTLDVLRLIVMPLMKPTLVTILFFIMLMSIKELSAAVLLQSARGLVLPVLIWNYVEQSNYQFAAAAGLVQTLLMIGLVVATRTIFGVKLENSMAAS